ncbi:MarR family transcriptional regulator [Runella sp. MFBS21]|uniref:MarR family winged helix-turn-helix transcriptional regulator n=1 Tax=Runella sp. MFBS21 TaxID=3034018 RepID=UPI0023F66F44|nr:MarR family transcriptional regulator [Runella sp. MFBS21]MDF7821572.1 MarR family transcriptional regulator [Runella sp. MFBS21]
MNDDERLYLENQICFPLYVVSRLTIRFYTPLLEELGITYPQYLVLLALWQKDEQLVGELSKVLYLDYNTLTPLLKRLEEKQFINRSRSKSDERSVYISLTETGKALKNQAACIPDKIMESLNKGDMNMDEIVAFQQTLWKIMKTVG